MATDESLVASFDLTRLGDAFYENPFPTYRALREIEPIRRMPDGSVFLTRHADIVAVYKNVKTFSSDKRQEFAPKYGAGSALFEHHTTSLVFNDPPSHTRVRRLLAAALTPKHIAAMEAGLVTLVDGLLDRLARESESRNGNGNGNGNEKETAEIDLIEAFCGAIPVEIIGNLLGVPAGERDPMRDWSLAILGALEPALTPEAEARGNAAVRDMLAYLEGLIADRRTAPGDPETDVLTRLIEGDPSSGESLQPAELLHNCIFLLNAGHETTTNLIGNGLKCLLDAPVQKARLVTDPELVKTAVEEFLRIESPNQLGNRISTAACEIGGVSLPAQTRITLCIGAANRDPEQFADPDVLDIARTPNRHLAFGSGIHQCVGMNLGRLEAKVAIGRFIARFPHYRLAGPALRSRRVRFRGHLRLPVVLHGQA